MGGFENGLGAAHVRGEIGMGEAKRVGCAVELLRPDLDELFEPARINGDIIDAVDHALVWIVDHVLPQDESRLPVRRAAL